MIALTLSRVTPGVGSTMLIILPAKALNKLDVPTFGLPIIATTGNAIACIISADAAIEQDFPVRIGKPIQGMRRRRGRFGRPEAMTGRIYPARWRLWFVALRRQGRPSVAGSSRLFQNEIGE